MDRYGYPTRLCCRLKRCYDLVDRQALSGDRRLRTQWPRAA